MAKLDCRLYQLRDLAVTEGGMFLAAIAETYKTYAEHDAPVFTVAADWCEEKGKNDWADFFRQVVEALHLYQTNRKDLDALPNLEGKEWGDPLVATTFRRWKELFDISTVYHRRLIYLWTGEMLD